MLPVMSSVSCPALSYFSTLSHKRHDFGEKVIQHKICVWIFSTTFVWNISHSKKSWARYNHECILVFILSMGFSFQILMKLEFSGHIFKKCPNFKFQENPCGGSQVVHADGWTSGRTGGRIDRQPRRSWYLLFAVLRRLKKRLYHTALQLAYTSIFKGGCISRIWYWFCNLLNNSE